MRVTGRNLDRRLEAAGCGRGTRTMVLRCEIEYRLMLVVGNHSLRLQLHQTTIPEQQHSTPEQASNDSRQAAIACGSICVLLKEIATHAETEATASKELKGTGSWA